jgi:hypothetical protein
MAQLSEWLELMLAEIARRQEEAQLDAEEEARRVREALPVPDAPDAISAPQSAPTPAEPSNAADALEPNARRRRRG